MTAPVRQNFASTIVDGPVGSHDIGRLELLVSNIAKKYGRDGSVHLHAHSYSVRFKPAL